MRPVSDPSVATRAGLAKARRMAQAMALDGRLREAHPRRPLLVGQAPGRGLDGWPALTGAAGNRLAELAGLEFPGARRALALMLVSERVNVLPNWPGRDSSGQGDAFPMSEARPAAALLLDRLEREGRLSGRRVLFVGRAVAEAFSFREDWFRWRPVEHAEGVVYTAAAFPHPSGRNRFWNEDGNRRRGGDFLSALLQPEVERLGRERRGARGRIVRPDVESWRQ